MKSSNLPVILGIGTVGLALAYTSFKKDKR